MKAGNFLELLKFLNLYSCKGVVIFIDKVASSHLLSEGLRIMFSRKSIVRI